MKQEWFESNDFVKQQARTSLKSKLKRLQTRLKKRQPISIHQLEKILKQRRKSLKLKSNWKASKKRKLKLLKSVKREQKQKKRRHLILLKKSQTFLKKQKKSLQLKRAKKLFLSKKQPRKSHFLSVNLQKVLISPTKLQNLGINGKSKCLIFGLGQWKRSNLLQVSLKQVSHTVTQPFSCSFCFLHLPFSLVSITSNMLTMDIQQALTVASLSSQLL